MSSRATIDIPVGTTATRTVEVTHNMTVARFHPGMPEVLGTPMMIYQMELAATDALTPYLPPGHVSVGTLVNVRHLAATPVGATVTTTAEVLSVSDKEILFSVVASDGHDKIGEGQHGRAVIDQDRFERGVRAKTGK